MRKHIFSIFAVLALVMTPAVNALSLSNETLHYEIVYQWGVIWKHAGDATLSVSKDGDVYNASLTGMTRSWADKIYPVRDTLTS